MDIISFSTIKFAFLSLARSFLGAFSSALKLFFSDLPTIGGISLGWWFVGLSIIPLILSMVIGNG